METYALKQCAADRSHVLLINVAPQRWMLFRWRLACHGHSPDDTPPVILDDPNDLLYRSPQTIKAKGKKIFQLNKYDIHWS